MQDEQKMRTIRLLITFDGTGYHGWQRQHNDITVQGVLEDCLSAICKQEITLHGAGRTDAGVHALGMVAHFHTATTIPCTAFCKGLNSMLPRSIRILEAIDESAGFHSRFSALGKTYRYDFFTGDVQHPFTRNYVGYIPGDFRPGRIQEAAEILTGTHDFSSFERSGSRDKTDESGRGAVRTLFQVECCPLKDEDSYSIRVTGDGFLRQMVRILCGTLIEMGMNKRPPESMQEIIEGRNRTLAGITAPACGLYLERIYYREILFD